MGKNWRVRRKKLEEKDSGASRKFEVAVGVL